MFGIPIFNGGPAVAEAGAIFSELEAYWQFRISGDNTKFLDEHGSNDLISTANGSAFPASNYKNQLGMAGMDAYYTAASNDAMAAAVVPRSNNQCDLNGPAWSMFGWFAGQSNIDYNTRFLMGRWYFGEPWVASLNVGTDSSNSPGKFQFGIWTGDGSSANLSAIYSDVVVVPHEFRFVCCTYDGPSGLMRLMIKSPGGVDFDSTQEFSGTICQSSPNTNFSVSGSVKNDSIGSGPGFTSHVSLPYGKIALAGLSNKALNRAEFLYLYASGAGRTYAQLVADAS